MLERDEIWLSPDGGVFDAADRSPLGRIAAESAWWTRRPTAFVATEGPDQSLVFSLRRGWPGWTWTVRESDGVPVAWLRGGLVLTADRRVLGRYHAAAHGGGRCRGWTGDDWATWLVEGGGSRVRFGPAIRAEPFLKMTALGCVLSATMR